jgi:uncharacterized repeat protein (TIGR01451 family)
MLRFLFVPAVAFVLIAAVAVAPASKPVGFSETRLTAHVVRAGPKPPRSTSEAPAGLSQPGSPGFVHLARSFSSGRSRQGQLEQLQTRQVFSTTTITTDTILILTYPYSQALFLSSNATYNIAFPVLNWRAYVPVAGNQPYTRLTLENDWLRVSILPELGGRVYEMIFKPTGSNELYKNPVIKPTGWGPPEQGWWLAAGGIEWGLPVEEHGYESAMPWSYAITQSSAGVTVTLRDSTAPDRLRASVDVFLPSDRAVLIIRPRIENARGFGLNFKWWANAMLAPGPANTVGPDLRFVFPVDAVTVHSTNDDRLPGHGWPGPNGPTAWISWPVYNGVDWSRLGNFDEWFGFFGRPQARQDFVGVYDTAANEGVVRIFPRSVATGIKGFAMGWLHPIGSSEWTDDGSTYVELHGGLAPTFWDSAYLGAGQSIQWEETWYPVAGIGSFTVANAEAALRVEKSGATLHLGAFSTRARGATRLAVYQRSTCSLLADYPLAAISPATPITRSLTTSVPVSDLAVVFSEGETLIAAYNISSDGLPPSASVSPLPHYVTTTTFTVNWSGVDADCVRSFDVQAREGLGGAWTPWLSDTAQWSGVFTGAHGGTYFFRARARDLPGNLGAYRNQVWGDAFTSVLLTPAAVMETSHKSAPALFRPGQSISCTLVLSNTGNLAGSLTLTDTLPPSMTLVAGTLSASSGPPPLFDGVRITWSGIVTSGDSALVTYALTPTLDLGFGQPQTNTVVVEGGVATVIRWTVTTLARSVYLPLILRAFAQ